VIDDAELRDRWASIEVQQAPLPMV